MRPLLEKSYFIFAVLRDKLATATAATTVVVVVATAATVRAEEKNDDKDNDPTAVVTKYVTH